MEKGGQPIRADGCGWQRSRASDAPHVFAKGMTPYNPDLPCRRTAGCLPAYGNQPWERQFIQVLVEDWKAAAQDMGFSRPSI